MQDDVYSKTASDYAKILSYFLKTGVVVHDIEASDPIAEYLYATMNDDFVKVRVLGNVVCSRIFYDSMMRFVTLVIDKVKFQRMRAQAEYKGMSEALEWTLNRKKDGWMALIQMVSSKHPNDFPGDFYIRQFGDGNYGDERLWKQMVMDWRSAVENEIKRKQREVLDKNGYQVDDLLKKNLQQIPKYLERANISEEEFIQGWNIMGGLWNELVFEKALKVVKLQEEYPVIKEIARKMGRKLSSDGAEKISIGFGDNDLIPHASKSDIAGITIGNHISNALPTELALGADAELDTLFLRKVLSNRLQTFDCRSIPTKPTRGVVKKTARRKGPIIVCLDTSGSMNGKPLKIAQSLLLCLLETAIQEKRECYLISFAVDVKTFNAVENRALLLDHFGTFAGGGTNASRMIEETLRVLNTEAGFAGADVLWITDFNMPLPSQELQDKMLFAQHQDEVQFIGLQISIFEHEWQKLFQHFYQIEYTEPRRLGK